MDLTTCNGIVPFHGSKFWPTAWLRWEFVPESAFHRFMVRMHGRQVVAKTTTGGKYAHGRDWVECRLTACAVMVSFNQEASEIKIQFDPKSTPDAQREAYVILREEFTDMINKHQLTLMTLTNMSNKH